MHGNEPSSSEAAMMLLYALTDSSNKQIKEWLKNTVVVIDPCLNPDGRDRYVNWFNSVVGKEGNPDIQSREHNEPWLGGRTNHYNFDLNRDWAWQTQIETQQRVKKYDEWMPQVHVDFHEQEYNNPYYFAPAAEPFHEVITKWQRDFQTIIGKNNAAHFDANGWLYFTKERFDLFYPSYGDTYPTYNGAIGMTYEQAGHSMGGLSVITDIGDTLTLADRILHHYTTSLSTIEVTSKNARQVVTEFKKYFEDNCSAKNCEFKTYILTSNDENKLDAVKELLDKNGIEYGTVSGKMKGFRYFSGKEEEVQLQDYTLAVSMYQPRSSLAKVLFEPKSKLSDSATYDITAWSIPYAYGLEAYAIKERKEVVPNSLKLHIVKQYNAAAYGYLIPYQSLNSAKCLAYLLKNKVKVRFADKAFVYNQLSFPIGTLIILKTSNATIDWNGLVNKAVQQFNIHPTVVAGGFVDKGSDFGSSEVHYIKAPKVALLTGENISYTAAGEVWNLFDQVLDYPVSLINATDINRININDYDVLVLPDGNYHSLLDKVLLDKLKEYVKNGGKIVALENAVVQFASNDWGIILKDDKGSTDKMGDDYGALKKYSDRDREDLSNSIPGAIYKVEIDNTHPLAYGYPDYYYTLKMDANIYEFLKDGWNVGVFKKENYVAGYSGYKVRNKLKDGCLFGVRDMGKGSFVFLGDDPLFRMFWENGKLLFFNSIFIVGQ